MAATKQEELDFLMTEEGDNSEPSGILPAGGTRLRLVAPLGVFMVLAVIAWLALSPSVDPVAPKRFSRPRSHRSGSGIAGFSMFGGESDDDYEDFADLESDDDYLEEKSNDHVPTFQEALAYDRDEDGLISKEELLTLFGNANAEDQFFWEGRFLKADKDGDGGLDEEEFGLLNLDKPEHIIQGIFLFLDKDEDGLVSKEEVLTWLGHASGKPSWLSREAFPEADKDGDGGLEEEEFENLVLFIWASVYDKDQDGLLSKEELLAMSDGHAEIQAVWERRFPTADKDGNGGLDEEEFGPFLNEDFTFQETLAYDKDQDGLLSKKELIKSLEGWSFVEEHWTEFDTNGDGLDEEEFGNFLNETRL